MSQPEEIMTVSAHERCDFQRLGLVLQEYFTLSLASVYPLSAIL